MASVRVTVASPVGLHARPAALFVQAVAASGLPVTIAKVSDAGAVGAPIDARSILGVLALDVRQGDEVILAVDGSDVGSVLGQLAAQLGSG